MGTSWMPCGRLPAWSGTPRGHLSHPKGQPKMMTIRRATETPGSGRFPSGAAYRNRTDDLRITRRIRGVQCRPPGYSCPARRISRSGRVHGHPGLPLANLLARQVGRHSSCLDHVTSWLQNAGRLRHAVAELARPALRSRARWQVAGCGCGQCWWSASCGSG